MIKTKYLNPYKSQTTVIWNVIIIWLTLVEQRKYTAHYVFVDLWKMKKTNAKMINLPKLINFIILVMSIQWKYFIERKILLFIAF